MADEGDIIRTVLKYSSSGASEQLNVFWWIIEDNGIGNPALLTEVETWVNDVWAPAWMNVAAGSTDLVDVSVDIMNPDGTVKVNVGVADINLAGGGPAFVTSAAISGYLLAQTDNPKSRGSKYIPGIAEAEIDDGLFGATAVIELLILTAIYVSPITTGVGAILVPGLLSRATMIFRNFLVQGSTTDVPAYQRRRKPNVGS